MYSNFAVSDTSVFKQKVLNWLKPFNTFCFLDSNQYQSDSEMLVGAGVARLHASSSANALAGLQLLIEERKSWLFGHLGYELATTEKISHSHKENQLAFPDLFFFEPEIVLQLNAGVVRITAANPDAVFEAISQQPLLITETKIAPIEIKSKIDKNEYLAIINQLKKHIQRGDCYEINFCQEFFGHIVDADPFTLFKKLNNISPNPFSGIYRMNDKWLLCASPERYIKKTNNTIISQPIKGTLQRNIKKGNIKDEQQQLFQSQKDKAENVMVVDLVRNDLSRICEEGSVHVDELFGIYSFPQVHQMISTISGTLKNEINFKDIIDATFPMGSMTGAPKISVMQLIDKYEKSKRGIFSGALGYLKPNGDCDFNVIIRSIMYNQSTQYLSFQAGSGITIYSDAENEWEECMIKAKAIKSILEDASTVA